MWIENISRGDVLVSTDENGSGYYKVLKKNRVTVDVLCENGNRVRMRPHLFDRKVTYPVAAFTFGQPASAVSSLHGASHE